MTHTKNKVEWCLKKAEKEFKEGKKHRGLRIIQPNKERARDHIKKSEHYLKATILLNKENFSDISASTIFYSIYHCFLAIAIKFGYESRNQECTFALIHSLIYDNKINLEKNLVEKVASLDTDKKIEDTTTNIRERYQYETKLSLKEDLYDELLELAKNILNKTKGIIEE